LTGRFVTDYSDGTGTNMVDLNTLKWSDEIISTMAIDGSKLPDLHASTDVVGLVTAAASAATGLSTRTKVVCGGGDGVCAAVGAGCIREGVAYQVVGSSSWISLTTEKPVFDENRRTFNWAHIVPGYVAPCGTMQAAGVSYNWLKNTICASEVMAAEEQGISPYQLMDAAAEHSTVGAHGLLFLPYLMGERSPRWNPNARGAFIGLKVEHKRDDMIRSVLEGITLNMNVILDVYKQVVDIKELVVIGAGAKGRIWRQIMADIYGVQVLKMNVLEEATSMGAAVTGGVGAGIYKDFSVIDQYIHVEEIQTPDPANRIKYQRLMPIFEASYASLLQVYESLADLS
jgi:xylulokinase